MIAAPIPPVREAPGGPPAPSPRALPPAGPADRYDGVAFAAARKPPGPLEEKALEDEERQKDEQRAREIYARMAADRRLFEARLQALIQDLQTELFEIWQEVMVRRRKAHDEVLEMWHKVLTG